MEHTWGWHFPLFTFLSALLNHAFFFGVFNALSVTLYLPRIRRKAGGIRGKYLSERLPASQPTSKRLPFDLLFVLLTDRIALSYTIHERCCPLTYLKSAQGILFSETCYTVFLEPPRVLQGVLPWKLVPGGFITDLFNRIAKFLP